MFLVLVRFFSLILCLPDCSNFKIWREIRKFMIQKEELEQILNFVASRWTEATRDPNNKSMETLPDDFWMNSIGGKTAKKGYWITTLMYTENEADAAGFKEVLMRWQAKGQDKNKDKGPDLIQIGKKK
jgi:hypothetical protein